MMMEETDDSVNMDDSSHPPSFAMPPGRMQEEAQSETNSVANPAPADPFDLLSMTAAPTTATTAPAPVSDFDVFGSAPFPSAAAPAAAAPAPDLWGGGATAGATNSTGAIDISTQESMIGPTCSSPKLRTAESGDLLGLAGPSPAAHSPPPNDFMDSDFQSMPLTAPSNPAVDPFGNTDLFQPVQPAPKPIAKSSTDSLLNIQPPQTMQTQQPALGAAKDRASSPVPRANSPKRAVSDAEGQRNNAAMQGKRFSFSQEIAQAKKVLETTPSSASSNKAQGAKAGTSPPRQRPHTPPSANGRANAGAKNPTAQVNPTQTQRARSPTPSTNAPKGSSPTRQRSRTPPAPNTKQTEEPAKQPTHASSSKVNQARKQGTSPTPATTKASNGPNPQVVNAQGKGAAKDGSPSPLPEKPPQGLTQPISQAQKQESTVPPPTAAKTPNGPNQMPGTSSQMKQAKTQPSNTGPPTQIANGPNQPSSHAKKDSEEKSVAKSTSGPSPTAGSDPKDSPKQGSSTTPPAEKTTSESPTQESGMTAPAAEGSSGPTQPTGTSTDGKAADPSKQASGTTPPATTTTSKPNGAVKQGFNSASPETKTQPPEAQQPQAVSTAPSPQQEGSAPPATSVSNGEKGTDDSATTEDKRPESTESVAEEAAITPSVDNKTNANGQRGETTLAEASKKEPAMEQKSPSDAAAPEKPEELVDDEAAEFEEEAGFEEVELASPQRSGEQDRETKKADEAAKAEALASGVLKPPSLATMMNDQKMVSQEELSAKEKQLAKTQEDLAAEAKRREEQESKVKALEEQLAAAKKEVETLQHQKKQIEQQHKDSQEETATVLQEIQNKLQQEQSQRAEAENKNKIANNQIERMKSSMQEREEQWEQQSEAWKQQLTGLEKENEALIAKAKQELEDRKEHERRERVLANKLNTLKKQQATKTDVEEVYEDDLRLLKDDVNAKTKQVEELQASEANLKQQLEQEKAVSKARIEQLEKAVREEKQLNEDRKKKMKAFIETKAEELKEAKADSENYQAELNRNNQSMVDLNNRWKTLHAQWVQSQTRNRELQRDLNKIKKDSENLHKVGDSLNVKLSRSANDIEQHKNKRLAAKQELMSVLGKLEAEREITNKLRDSIRFTFTSKAQSQHQLLQEALTEFNKQLEALARRLGRPIPLTNDGGHQSLSSLVMSAVDESERSEGDDAKRAANGGTNGGQQEEGNNGGGGGASKEQKRILAETTRLLAKLENETQHISQGIMALTSAIEQMNTLINGGGEKTCFTSLGDIFFGGGMAKALEADKAKNPRSGRGTVRYGHSSTMPTQSGTMT